MEMWIPLALSLELQRLNVRGGKKPSHFSPLFSLVCLCYGLLSHDLFCLQHQKMISYTTNTENVISYCATKYTKLAATNKHLRYPQKQLQNPLNYIAQTSNHAADQSISNHEYATHQLENLYHILFQHNPKYLFAVQPDQTILQHGCK